MPFPAGAGAAASPQASDWTRRRPTSRPPQRMPSRKSPQATPQPPPNGAAAIYLIVRNSVDRKGRIWKETDAARAAKVKQRGYSVRPLQPIDPTPVTNYRPLGNISPEKADNGRLRKQRIGPLSDSGSVPPRPRVPPRDNRLFAIGPLHRNQPGPPSNRRKPRLTPREKYLCWAVDPAALPTTIDVCLLQRTYANATARNPGSYLVIVRDNLDA